MRVLYRNNDGGGFAKWIDLDEGVPIGEFVAGLLPAGKTPDDYTITVNGQVVARADELNEGDAVVVHGLTLDSEVPAHDERGADSRVTTAPKGVDGNGA